MVATSAWPAQAFVLSREILDSVSFEEVEATWRGMEEMGLARPPFERMDIHVPEAKAIVLVSETGERSPPEEGRMLIYRYDGASLEVLLRGARGWENMQAALELVAGNMGRESFSPSPDWKQTMDASGRALMKILIVLLATRNVVKERRECKTLRLGIGSRERNLYTTTLTIGAVVERADGAGAGSGVGRRPHLRRGHVRRQHHGPRNELVKQIWVEPVFVNADEAWVGARSAYNVSMARSPVAA